MSRPSRGLSHPVDRWYHVAFVYEGGDRAAFRRRGRRDERADPVHPRGGCGGFSRDADEREIVLQLIISAPDMAKAVLTDRLANTGVDLLPTLCDYAGIPVPGTFAGLSLRPESAAGGDPRTYIFVHNKMIQGSPVDGQNPEPAGRMVRSRRFKYCAYDLGTSRESLFDMERDPGETLNLAGNAEYRKDLEQHRRYLAAWCSANNDRFETPVTTTLAET